MTQERVESAGLAPQAAPESVLPTSDARVAEPDPKRFIALAVIAMAQLMIVLDMSIVNLAIPRASAELGIIPADVHWVVTSYTLAFGGFLLLGGRIADYLGRKKVLIIGLLAFAAASLIGAIAPTAGSLFAARTLQGLAAALMAPAALALISVTFTDAKERARAFGVFGAISGAGAAIGLLAGGALTEFLSWRWTLAINTPIALLAVVLAVKYVRESRIARGDSYDVAGATTVTLGLVSLVYGFTKAAPQGPTDSGHWTDPSTMVWFGLAAALLAAFVVIETRVSSPLLPIRVITERNRAGAYLSLLLVGTGMFAMFLFLGLYLQTILGYSPLEAGFAFLPFTVGIVLGAGLVSTLMNRVKAAYLMVPGLLAAALGMFLLSQITPDSTYVGDLLAPMLIISFGMAFVFVPTASVGLHAAGTEDAGVASALINTSQQVGGSVGTALMNTLAVTTSATFLAAHAADGDSSLAAAATEGYTAAFTLGAVIMVVAAVVVALLVRVGPEDLEQSAEGGAVV